MKIANLEISPHALVVFDKDLSNFTGTTDEKFNEFANSKFGNVEDFINYIGEFVSVCGIDGKENNDVFNHIIFKYDGDCTNNVCVYNYDTLDTSAYGKKLQLLGVGFELFDQAEITFTFYE